jgi:hypothetical protein
MACPQCGMTICGEHTCGNSGTYTPPTVTAPTAQFAPSAERWLYKKLGFSFKAINSSLTVCVFEPIKVMSLSQSDGKWDVVYLMDKAWDLLVELAADKQAAALRTAQLERELRAELKKTLILCDEETVIGGIRNLAQAHVLNKSTLEKLEKKLAVAETRAETAESALRDAKKL